MFRVSTSRSGVSAKSGGERAGENPFFLVFFFAPSIFLLHAFGEESTIFEWIRGAGAARYISLEGKGSAKGEAVGHFYGMRLGTEHFSRSIMKTLVLFFIKLAKRGEG